jgi:hypothetical protein
VRLDLADQLQALLLGVVDLALERADLVLEGDQQGHVLAREAASFSTLRTRWRWTVECPRAP